LVRAPTGEGASGADTVPPESVLPGSVPPQSAPSAFLSRQQPLVLIATCLLVLAFVGWAAIRYPVPAISATAAWGLFMLRRRIGQALGGIPKARGPAPPRRETLVAETMVPGRALIQPDLVMEGRLTGAMLVEVHGRLAGEVRCDTMLVYPGGELVGRVAQRRIGIAVGALFEGVAATLAQPETVPEVSALVVRKPDKRLRKTETL
jgi:hypothetical protein